VSSWSSQAGRSKIPGPFRVLRERGGSTELLGSHNIFMPLNVDAHVVGESGEAEMRTHCDPAPVSEESRREEVLLDERPFVDFDELVIA